MKNIVILGATGSIGTSTLKVIDNNCNDFKILAVSAKTDYKKMLIICEKYHPKYAVMTDDKAAIQLKKNLNTTTEVLSGEEALIDISIINEVDIVIVAIVGASAIKPTLAAAKKGKNIALANKESIVLAGDILLKTAKNNNATIIPVDSEHNAIFQILTSGTNGLNKIQLTASGGPFLNTPLEQLKKIKPEEACSHPNWSMGKKISVDSSTMMNKGLEVIEAHYLFNMPYNKIDVIIHPQSIVHSLVYFKDGSVISQLGNTDMCTAIAYSLGYPMRIKSGVKELDLTKHKLEFFTPDMQKFKCLALAYNALKNGASSMGVLNASNEVAVEAFLNKKIAFLDIAKIIEINLSQMQSCKLNNIGDVLANDALARIKAKELL